MARANSLKWISTLLLVAIVATTLIIPAYAANENFGFTLANKGQVFTVYTGASNEKVLINDPATVKADSINIPVYGFAFRMCYKSGDKYYNATNTDRLYWLSGPTTIHPAYADGMSVVGRSYYVSARIDDSLTGTYTCSGRFNADYTEPA